MILQILAAVMVCAIIILQFWVSAKMITALSSICKTIAHAEVCVRHIYQTEEKPAEHVITQQEIEYEQEQQKVVDAAIALQKLFLGDDVVEGVR